ncbi:sigma-70 family RNA polymerase sigma factor [Parvularcula lutaonensis]|uniref:Sigma-70 family RNA polymerase sigma factor n=1 Tax=Parvularcula lutaonensis TaxID=491923 RepID=A0ABV7MAP2_9PROT|nr:sigma-70 family RNA polymerase sigma factor [Parvularcula lutaonensis]
MGALQDQLASAYTLQEEQAAAVLVEEHYDALLRIARSKRRRHAVPISLLTHDIVHEALLKLSGTVTWTSNDHFVSTAVLAIRQVICDYARRRTTASRDRFAEVPMEQASPLFPEFEETPEDIVAITNLISAMGVQDARWPRLLDARYFSGMTEEETAELMGCSTRTVRREWRAARNWLAQQMAV